MSNVHSDGLYARMCATWLRALSKIYIWIMHQPSQYLIVPLSNTECESEWKMQAYYLLIRLYSNL